MIIFFIKRQYLHKGQKCFVSMHERLEPIALANIDWSKTNIHAFRSESIIDFGRESDT